MSGRVGFLMLCHTALDRAAQVARFWAEAGAPVVIHVDRRTNRHALATMREELADLALVSFCPRQACDWGTWSLVAASLAAAEQMLARHPGVEHVFLASGSCLPLRPLAELEAYLQAHPGTDFIESVTTSEVGWTVGGLDMERFTLRFPFSWKRHRRLFDRYTDLQRRVGFSRNLPEGLDPHLGSQWWCLSTPTLRAILDSPRRTEMERYFRKVWIPDESYFQTLVRHVSDKIESRSLTLSTFDFQGKPHLFYDDHLQLLRRSDCFVARKIWPRADRLYHAFLKPRPEGAPLSSAEPNPRAAHRLFDAAVERRTRGRAGLYMQSRFPERDRENGKTSGPYSIFQGFSDIFENFDGWLARHAGGRVHGHLFAPERAEFAGGDAMFAGALSDSAALRDYNPLGFLSNVIWNARGERQCFMFSPRDTQDINWFVATDPNAQISVVSGAWALALFHQGGDFATQRREAARLQRLERAQLEILRSVYVKARVRIWTLADFIQAPAEPLQEIIDEIAPRGSRRLHDLPKMVALDGFGLFLQKLKNAGMQPRVMGEFPVSGDPRRPDRRLRPPPKES